LTPGPPHGFPRLPVPASTRNQRRRQPSSLASAVDHCIVGVAGKRTLRVLTAASIGRRCNACTRSSTPVRYSAPHGSDSVLDFRCVFGRFTCVHLLSSCLPAASGRFLRQSLTTMAFWATAALLGLKPASARRLRGACPHLLYRPGIRSVGFPFTSHQSKPPHPDHSTEGCQALCSSVSAAIDASGTRGTCWISNAVGAWHGKRPGRP
jgi:hypothetical protein